MAVPVLHTPDDLTLAWLTDALGHRVDGFRVEPIGAGQSSSTYRLHLDGEGPPDTAILKLADPDSAVRRTGVVTGFYEREVDFYADIASALPADALAPCHVAVYDAQDGHFTLLMDDCPDAEVGDQLAGCSVETARLVVRELARLVASVVEDEDLRARVDTPLPVDGMVLGMMLPQYFERFGNRIDPEHRMVVEGFAAAFDTWNADAPGPNSIVHNDFRLDNMLFGGPDAARTLTIVDWATLRWGPLTSDLAFFLGGSLTIEDRREHEMELVRLFHDELVGLGVTAHSFEECWDGYRWMAFAGVLMAVGAPLMVTETERGDAMFMTMLQRHSQQVLDLDSLGLLRTAHRRALQVDPADEALHAPGGEVHWNESYYCDAISADGKLGAYVRAGIVPNLGHTVYTAYIVGKGRPAVAVLDYSAPLPTEGLAVTTDRFTSDLVVEEPLKKFRATISGTGESFSDPTAPLRGGRGEPVQVELDLLWETEGDPYKFQVTTRYEMPCRVTGTIRIGDEVLELEGPGQRDHSWGDRNWWSMDWTWASAHLDDETRLQVIELRLPGLPVAAVGYEQRGSDLTEISAMGAAYSIPANRHPGLTTATLGPTGTRLEWEPIAYAPLRIAAPDGRVCEFPRAMARVTTADGRTGLGWLEWGHNVDEAGSQARRALAPLKHVAERAAGRLLGRVPDSTVDRLMSSRAGRHVVAAAFRGLPLTLDARRAQVADAIVRFNISDVASGAVDTYDLVLRSDAGPLVHRRHQGEDLPQSRIRLTLTGTDFLLLGLGRLDPVRASLQRRVLIEGDMQFMAVVATILAGDRFPPPQPLD